MTCPFCPDPDDPAPRPGTFCFVVGPSGVGKDTLINGAREALAGCGRFHFIRRVITRKGNAGGEVHDAVSPEKFRIMREEGAFCLSWSAHGEDYGIPTTVNGQLCIGRHVIANGSRRMVEAARKAFPTFHVIHVTAPREILGQRLLARGREARPDIEERLAREAPSPTPGPGVSIVENGGTRQDGIRRFLGALHRLTPGCAALRDYT